MLLGASRQGGGSGGGGAAAKEHQGVQQHREAQAAIQQAVAR